MLSPNDVGNITRLAARPNFFGGNRPTNLNSSCLVIADDLKSPESRPAFKGLGGEDALTAWLRAGNTSSGDYCKIGF